MRRRSAGLLDHLQRLLGRHRGERKLPARREFRVAGAGRSQREPADSQQRPKQPVERPAIWHRRAAATRPARPDRGDRSDGGDRPNGGHRQDGAAGPRRANRVGGLLDQDQDNHQKRPQAQDHGAEVVHPAGVRDRKFKIASNDLGATIARAGVTYARGFANPTGTGRWELALTQHLRTLRPGRYTLTLRRRHGQRQIRERTKITIT